MTASLETDCKHLNLHKSKQKHMQRKWNSLPIQTSYVPGNQNDKRLLIYAVATIYDDQQFI